MFKMIRYRYHVPLFPIGPLPFPVPVPVPFPYSVNKPSDCIDQNHFLCLRFRIFLSNGRFNLNKHIPNGWIHIVANFIGPNDGQGIRLYYDGAEVAGDTTKTAVTKSIGDGRIVVGRYYTDRDEKYSSLLLDECIIFNNSLSISDIQMLSQDLWENLKHLHTFIAIVNHYADIFKNLFYYTYEGNKIKVNRLKYINI